MWSLLPLASLVACRTSASALPAAPPAGEPPPAQPVEIAWPEPGAALRVIPPQVPADFGTRRIVIDPGHGASPENLGNTGATCLREADEVQRISREVIPALSKSGLFEVNSSRPTEAFVDYGVRIEAADTWPADALVSLHSDMRGWESAKPDPETGCGRADGAVGFTVLWSDEGEAPLVAARERLAVAIAARLTEAGFVAYRGALYNDLYAEHAAAPGVFVDRHAPDQRVRMLRRPRVPSVIVETHEALDRREVARWAEARTTEAFASALHQALIDAL